jgi:DNA-cytosine methyltransferase
MLGNVLSLFDGISGGQVALDRLGIKYENYYASEIDKYAIQITQKNYPKTIQIGDVTKVKASGLPKIDLLMGGSPCQGFSIANQNRKNLVFNEYGVCSDERSQLFFEFVRLLKETKPDWWFLENVRMKKEHMEIVNKVLSDAVGYEVKPYLVNSSVRSGQNRLRYYWTNIPFENNLEDWGIKLKDILEPIPFSADYPNYLKLPIVRKKTGATKKTRGEMVRSIDDEKSFTVNATMWKGQKSSYVKAQEINPFRPCEPREIKKDSLCHHVADATDIKGNQAIKRVYGGEGKSPTLTTMGGGHREPKVLVPPKEVQDCIDQGMKNVAFTETRTEQAKQLRKEHMAKYKKDFSPRRAKVLQPRTDGKMNCITASMTKEHTVIDNNWYYRKLTPTECARLQTFPDGYCDGVSNTQQYKALGNSWTVDVICEFFKNIR